MLINNLSQGSHGLSVLTKIELIRRLGLLPKLIGALCTPADFLAISVLKPSIRELRALKTTSSNQARIGLQLRVYEGGGVASESGIISLGSALYVKRHEDPPSSA